MTAAAKQLPADPAHGTVSIDAFRSGVFSSPQYVVWQFSKRIGWQRMACFRTREDADGYLATITKHATPAP